MASIKKRENGQWRARYRDEGGKEHSRHFTRRVDAQRWLDETTASVVTGQYADPRPVGSPCASMPNSGEPLPDNGWRCSSGAVGHLQIRGCGPSSSVLTVRWDAAAEGREAQGGADQHRAGSGAGGGSARSVTGGSSRSRSGLGCARARYSV